MEFITHPTFHESINSQLPEKVVFYMQKLNSRGSFMYRKLIPNNSMTLRTDTGVVKGLKPSGAWLHEDDFGSKVISSPSKKLNVDIALVRIDDCGAIDDFQALYSRTKRKWVFDKRF